MSSWRISSERRPLTGVYTPPGDRLITHCALVFGSLTHEATHLRNALESPGTVATRRVLAHLGVSFTQDDDGWLVVGGGDGLEVPDFPLDCGTSYETLALALALLGGLGQEVELQCARDYRARLSRLLPLLKGLGIRADVSHATGGMQVRVFAKKVAGIECELPPGSPIELGALLAAGLAATGQMAIREELPNPDHAERLLKHMGAGLRRTDGTLYCKGGQRVYPRWLKVPGDLSAAAPLLLLACLLPGSELRITELGCNPHRIGLLKALTRSGAAIARDKTWQYGAEPVAELLATPGELVPFNVAPNLAAGMIDELPLLALAATQASGTSTIKGAAFMQQGGPDPVALVTQALQAFGASVEFDQDGFTIQGPIELQPAEVQCGGDWRVTYMAAAAAALAGGDTVLHGVEDEQLPFPGLLAELAEELAPL